MLRLGASRRPLVKEADFLAEIHFCLQGGHAFGVRHIKLCIGRWPALVEQWLRAIGVLASHEGSESWPP